MEGREGCPGQGGSALNTHDGKQQQQQQQQQQHQGEPAVQKLGTEPHHEEISLDTGIVYERMDRGSSSDSDDSSPGD